MSQYLRFKVLDDQYFYNVFYNLCHNTSIINVLCTKRSERIAGSTELTMYLYLLSLFDTFNYASCSQPRHWRFLAGSSVQGLIF
jgi:hypothetical protein